MALDLAGRVSACNGGAERLFGCSRHELIGASLLRFLRAGPELEAALNQVGRNELHLRQSASVVRSDGSMIDVVALAGPVREAGEVVGASLTLIDLTEIKPVTSALDSRARLARVQRMARIGWWQWEAAFGRVSWSAGMYRIHGVDHTHFHPSLSDTLPLMHPQDRPAVREAVLDLLTTGTAVEFNYRVVWPDEEVRLLHTRAEAVLALDGGIAEALGVCQDITDLRLTPRDVGEPRSRWLEDEQPQTSRVERRLSDRQRDILDLIAKGYSTADIAAKVFVAESTVKWHIRKIFRALEVTNRAEAVAEYLRDVSRS